MAFDVTKVPLHDCINQFPDQHLRVLGNTVFCTACKEIVSSKKSILTCHPILPCHCVPEDIKCDTNIVHFGTLRLCSIGINRFWLVWLVEFFRVLLGENRFRLVWLISFFNQFRAWLKRLKTMDSVR